MCTPTGARGERSVAREVPVEGGPWGVCSGQPRRIGIRIGGEQRYEKRSLHTRGELNLAAEPGPELGILGLRGMNDLHRDTEAGGIETGMNCPHTTRAETTDDPVGTDPLRITRAGGQDPPVGTRTAHRGFRSPSPADHEGRTPAERVRPRLKAGCYLCIITMSVALLGSGQQCRSQSDGRAGRGDG